MGENKFYDKHEFNKKSKPITENSKIILQVKFKIFSKSVMKPWSRINNTHNAQLDLSPFYT
jgi:hypothetical protein